AEPGDGVGRAHDPLQPAGHLDEEVVADGVAQRVVDDLEPVEVEEEHGDPARPWPAPGPGQRLAELVHEQPPVRQPRQRVVEGAVQRPPERRFGRECQRATGAVTGRSVRQTRADWEWPGRTSQRACAPDKADKRCSGLPAGSMDPGGEPAGRPRTGTTGPRNVRTP